MPKFEFRLAKIMSHRRTARLEAQRQLASANLQAEQAEEQITKLNQELANLEQHMREASNKKQINLDLALGGHRHHAKLQADMRKLAETLDEANDEVERCRRQLVEADRDVKALEKLHDKQLDDHRRDETKREASEVDDIVTSRHQTPEFN